MSTNYLPEWAEGTKRNPNFEHMEKEELAELLRCFYASCQTEDDENFSKSAYVSIRSGINRYLTLPPYNKEINIMQDKEFAAANKVFKGVLRQTRKNKRIPIAPRKSVTRKDLKKMYSYLCSDLKDPQNLQWKVYLDIAFYMARRGREGLKDLDPFSFEIVTPTGEEETEEEDEQGNIVVKSKPKKKVKKMINGKQVEVEEEPRRYVQMTHCEVKKKRQGDEASCSNAQEHPESNNRMYEQKGSKQCPVLSMEMYLKRIWACKQDGTQIGFFQRAKPKSKVIPDTKTETNKWYDRVHLGKNKLGAMLKQISIRAGCEYTYTNHRIRNTTATALHQAGRSLHQIAKVTDHANYQSLASYLEQPDDEEKEETSDMLFDYTNSPPPPEASDSEEEQPKRRKPTEFRRRGIEEKNMPAFLKKHKKNREISMAVAIPEAKKKKPTSTVSKVPAKKTHEHPNGSPCWSIIDETSDPDDIFGTPPESLLESPQAMVQEAERRVALRQNPPPFKTSNYGQVRRMQDAFMPHLGNNPWPSWDVAAPSNRGFLSQQNVRNTAAPTMFQGATFNNCNISFGPGGMNPSFPPQK